MRFVAEPKTIGRWIFGDVKEGVVPDASGQGRQAKLIGKAAGENLGRVTPNAIIVLSF